VPVEVGGGLARRVLVAVSRKSWPPAAKFAASLPPMLPVPMMATVWSETVIVINLS